MTLLPLTNLRQRVSFEVFRLTFKLTWKKFHQWFFPLNILFEFHGMILLKQLLDNPGASKIFGTSFAFERESCERKVLPAFILPVDPNNLPHIK